MNATLDKNYINLNGVSAKILLHFELSRGCAYDFAADRVICKRRNDCLAQKLELQIAVWYNLYEVDDERSFSQKG